MRIDSGSSNYAILSLDGNYAIRDLSLLWPGMVGLVANFQESYTPRTLTLLRASGLDGDPTVTVSVGANTIVVGGPVNNYGQVTLNLLANAQMSIQSSSTLEIRGPITGSYGMTKTDTGTLLITNGGNTYSGGTTVSDGTLTIDDDGSLGSGSLLIDGGTFACAYTRSFSNSVNVGQGGTVNTYSGNLTISGALTGAGSLTKIGTGTLKFTDGTTGFAGALAITAGTVDFAATTPSAPTLAGLSGSGVLTRSASGIAVVGVNNGSSSYSFSGSITGNLGLTKSGAATLALGGQNTYAGNTTIQAGTLEVSGSGNLGSASNSLVFDGGVLHATGTFSTGRAVSVGDGGGTISVDQGQTVTCTGAMTGGGALSKWGPGTLALTQQSPNHTGNVTVSAGTLSYALPATEGLSGGAAMSGSTVQALTTSSVGSLVIDLYNAADGSKTVHVSQSGEVVYLNVYATVNGTDPAALQGFKSLQGGFASSNVNGGAADGDLSVYSILSQYTANGSQNGTNQDLNGDGNLDIGGSSNDDYWAVRSDRMSQKLGQSVRFRLGQIAYTVKDIVGPDGYTSVNFLPRPENVGALWRNDADGLQDGLGDVLAGLPVVITSGGGLAPQIAMPDSAVRTVQANTIVAPATFATSSTRALLIQAGAKVLDTGLGDAFQTMNVQNESAGFAAGEYGFDLSGATGERAIGDLTGGPNRTGWTAVGSAAILKTNMVRQEKLTIDGRVLMNSGGSGASVLNTLEIAGATGVWTGLLDLADNDLILHASADTAESVLSTTLDQVKCARNTSGGLWQGNGIGSSAAAGDDLMGLGVILNRDGSSAIYTTFDGEAVDTNTILVKYTYNGDADLNGVVDGADYFLIDMGYLSKYSADPLRGWRNGDFDYNGVVDGADYFLIDMAYLATRAGGMSMGMAAVPEPGVVWVLCAGAAGLLRRRRSAGGRRGR